jgi:serine/threonine-protein kinase HipA
VILEAFYGGRKVGRLAESRKHPGRILFEFDPEWRKSGLDLSPVKMPLASTPGIVWFDSPAMMGLPGLFWDSLPDSWGMPLLRQRMRDAGRNPDVSSPLLYLAHIGARGMGAIEYVPDLLDKEEAESIASLGQLDRDALKIQERGEEEFCASELAAILDAGSAVGGARPKALIYTDRNTVRLSPAKGWEAWIVKLSTVPADHKDSKQAGEVEAAFAKMAGVAGIDVPAVRQFVVDYPKGKRQLFAIQRFDRDESGRRFHVQTAAALMHEAPVRGASSYETLARLSNAISGDQRDVEALFRRGVFNVLAGNRDDHLKNFSFLMDEKGRWRLSPAYDLTASPGPGGLGVHGRDQCTAMNGSLHPCADDMLACAETLGVEDGRGIIDEVLYALSKWPEIAESCGVRKSRATTIAGGFAFR